MRIGLKGALVAVAVAASGCSKGGAAASLPSPSASAAPRAMGVKAIAPATKLDANVMSATGHLRSRQQATLASRSSGPLTRVLVDVGDRVKKGQVLAQLDTASLSISVEQASASKAAAEAVLDGATLEVERARKLAESGSVPKSTLEKAEIAFRQARASAAQSGAALKNASQMLSDASIVAPFDGVITARTKHVGDMVNTSTAIFTLVDLEGIEVRAQVPETIIDSVQAGSVAKGTLSPTGARFEARVRTVGGVIDPQTRTVEVLADVLRGQEKVAFRPGALVELDFSTAAPEASTPKGVFLPAEAVSSQGQDGVVWVILDGRVERREVKVRSVMPGYVHVLEGLTAQERVVADASLPMKDGSAVRVTQ
ncbi:efflux RND transporter periplasmic adaptor subunit [Hyalangium versicolor]|uniref:efflux RND transporter periplasmic adaptor subunit n=1 Tax=Hyalangium versicolor TaxID=2861190 RepID=UPI001CCF4FD3|nr:efflux RND transporter periplasmic adaptor subunit [Hyalangium versicolor]